MLSIQKQLENEEVKNAGCRCEKVKRKAGVLAGQDADS
jgi:hypothetical protein